MAFFGIGGYAIGMWLMYARTEIIVIQSLSAAPLPPTPQEISDGIAAQIFGVVGASEFPPIWAVAHSLPLQLAAVVLVPGLLALVFGWLAFRSRVTGVYLSILTQAMTLALSLYLFQNDSGLRGNNGLSGLQNLPGLGDVPQSIVSIWFFWASALALGLGYLLCVWMVSGKFGSVIRAIRDDESARAVSWLSGRSLQAFHLHTHRHHRRDCGRALLPAGGHHQPGRDCAHRVHLPCGLGRHRRAGAPLWCGHRGGLRLAPLDLWFTGGQAPDINLGFYRIQWVDWWTDPAGSVLCRGHAVCAEGASVGCST